MKLAGETGSLLKIEEDIQEAIESAKRQWLAETEKATDRKGRELWWSRAEMDRIAGRDSQSSLFDVLEITDEQFWIDAEAKVLEALRDYAQRAENGRGLKRRLFADDAGRGFAFVDVCRKRFDVILMNPPFGSATKGTQKWFLAQYPSAAENLTVGVIIQSQRRLAQGGFIGLIGDIPWLQQSTYVKFRSSLLHTKSLRLFIELGWGILGTDVEVGLAIFTDNAQPSASFASLVGVANQATDLTGLFNTPGRFKERALSEFLVIENHPFAYQISDLSLSIFREGRLFCLSRIWKIAPFGLA